MSGQELLDNIEQAIESYCNAQHDFTFNPDRPVVRLHEPTFGTEEIFAAIQPMLSTFVTMGRKVKQFEGEYASKFGYKYGVMNNSGSSANLLAVAAIANPQTSNPLKPGDEVIVPALSWSTTVWPVIQSGLVPVIVDCEPDTWNFDLNKLESAISDKTRAIMPVHVYGNPCDMDAIMDIAGRHDLQVIEDCCEAMGGVYKGKPVGSFGRIGTFSFYYSHHITTLEGGICVTDEHELAETMRIMRAHGWSREADNHQQYVEKYPDIDPRFIFVNLGYNLRPTECQAAMGSVQLPKLDRIVITRRENAAFFRRELDKFSEFFAFQDETAGAESSWFGFGIIVKDSAPFDVADITAHLKQRNIETRPVIAGNIARHPVFEHYEHRIAGTSENSDNIMQNGFAFGCHHAIDTNAREYVVGAIAEFMDSQESRRVA